jgi:hypothetical protein
MPRKQNAHDEKRTMLRNQFWPGSATEIWDFKDPDTKGFATIPRLTPLILHLIRILVAKRSGDPSSVLLELWCRDFGQGIVRIADEQECAYSSGYSSNRALRTWRGHMLTLAELGFIRTKRKGNHEYGHVLLRNPLLVCVELHAVGKVPDEWWTVFLERASEIKAEIPEMAREADKQEQRTIAIRRA